MRGTRKFLRIQGADNQNTASRTRGHPFKSRRRVIKPEQTATFSKVNRRACARPFDGRCNRNLAMTPHDVALRVPHRKVSPQVRPSKALGSEELKRFPRQRGQAQRHAFHAHDYWSSSPSVAYQAPAPIASAARDVASRPASERRVVNASPGCPIMIRGPGRMMKPKSRSA